MYVYLMAGGENWHKIGVSYDPVMRRAGVSLYRPVDGYVELVMAVEVPDHKARKIETWALMHTKAPRCHYNQEWVQAPRRRVVAALYKSLRQHDVRKIKKLKLKRKSSKRPIVTTPEDDKLAESVWFDRRYKTNTEAMKHGPASYSRQRYYDKFGPSGRGN